MDNRTTLESIEKGYRMPKPTGPAIECPDDLYELTLMCWHKDADRRPTFEYLKSVFEDFSVATESSYKDAEGGF